MCSGKSINIYKEKTQGKNKLLFNINALYKGGTIWNTTQKQKTAFPFVDMFFDITLIAPFFIHFPNKSTLRKIIRHLY